ncbi:MAG: ABC transporter substrate-binding protein [Thermodesulfobacteriota bacterium]
MQTTVNGKRLNPVPFLDYGWLATLFFGWAVVLMAFLSGCEREKPPIRIGFSGGLTGRYSDLGVGGRNGVQLAVEEINRSGGIQGRPVELIIKDDRQDPDMAIQVDRELIRENVVAIVGHMTSAMTMAVMPLINAEKVLLISPTSSTSELTGIDDWFFRTAGTNDILATALADYLMNRTPIRRMAVMFDSSNRAYSESFIKAFRTRYEETGGRLTLVASFSGGNDPLRDVISQSLLKPACDGILILACGLDAAWICQQIRKQDSHVPLFATGWSVTQEFLEHGGNAVNGVRFIDYFDWNSQRPVYLRFQKAYLDRFGSTPSFSVIYAYEAAQVLFQALSQNPDPKLLKQTIVNIRRFEGMFQDFEIDAFGDVHRKPFLITAENGRYVVME